jgi:uncharacterized protein YegL
MKSITKNIDLYIVQDTSGSMKSQAPSVANGINEIIDDLKQRYKEPCEYTATITYCTFSSNALISIGEQISIKDFPLIEAPQCNGLTAMWDALGPVLTLMQKNSSNVSAVLYVFTDGSDNDSYIYNKDKISEMIESKSKMHSVLFVGSDPTSAETAHSLGLDRNSSIQHVPDNTPIVYEVCRRALARCVIGDTQTTIFSEDDIVLSETPQHSALSMTTSWNYCSDNVSSM